MDPTISTTLDNFTYLISQGISATTHTHGQHSLHLKGSRPVIQTDRNTINIDDVAETLQVVKERLLILTPDFEKMEKYPALKIAYDNYKMVEAMLRDGD